MSEQPGNPDPEDPNGSGDAHGEEPEGEDFGFLVGSDGYESSLSLDLGGVEHDPEVGKRAFDASIPALNAALLDYAHALEARQGRISDALLRPELAPELFTASGGVHAALDELLVAHQVYTGEGLPEVPPQRSLPDEPTAPEDWAELVAAIEATEDADDTHWPRPTELGATVILDHVIHQTPTEFLRLDTAQVFGNGVLLMIDCVVVRGVREDGLIWFRRSNEQHGNVEITLELRDADTGAPQPCAPHRADGNVGPHSYTLNHQFWIHPAPEAEELAGTVTVHDAIGPDGTAEPLEVQFRLATSALREAAQRIRTFGNREPGT
ncbi:hypothetical protein GCM10009715_26440 [Paeniglutamicibacter psychrophenolicus]|uniref:Uncharacterized protein n=1 Tax=Paeniglutamicibacter psychrophenolicus TaxID=257454 RepID=A0ABS4WEP0_9MICC|nr:hypothetical protein [Paeniglutamicibacter psychrophenolicus]MBP2374598.1 hypothetical protein [Paeniglutamicibacter psychrophenolicus]